MVPSSQGHTFHAILKPRKTGPGPAGTGDGRYGVDWQTDFGVLSEGRSGERRVEPAVMLEDATGCLEEFAHEGSDDDHGRFACLVQPGGESGQGVLALRAKQDKGGHVEGFAQAAVALLAHAAAAPHAGAGFAQGGGESGPGGGIAHALEAFQRGQLGEDGDGGGPSDAGDALEQGECAAKTLPMWCFITDPCRVSDTGK